ncbi:unnamed protein product [Prunus armeniaca]
MGPPLTVNNKEELSPPQALNGSLPKYGHRGINWDLISVEIGFTVGFGVSVGSLVLCKRWSKWYHKAMYRMILKIFPQLEERIGIHRRHVHINRRWRVEEQCSWTPIHLPLLIEVERRWMVMRTCSGSSSRQRSHK